MQSLVALVDDRLANAGDTLPLTGHLEEGGYSLGEHDFALPKGLDYDLILTNAGDGILATGMLTAEVLGSCDRCLEPASFELSCEVNEYYLFHAPSETRNLADDEDDVDFLLVGADKTIDLASALSSALLMETPYVVLCQEDCAGLCPVCGANLNTEDCGHAGQLAEQAEQERLDASPFAALRQLKLEDEASE